MNEINIRLLARTENGDVAYYSSGDYLVDLLSLIGASRSNPSQCRPLFKKAFSLDKERALSLLLYARDIRGGLGERAVFRTLYHDLAIDNPDLAVKIIPLVIEFGRYDDLFVLIGTKSEPALIELIKKTLEEDLASPDGSVSLLSKWMPSINASNPKTINLARHLAKALGLSNAEYRKILSELRKGRIVENNLRTMDYSFDYQSVPAQAFHKYRAVFERNDGARYHDFIDKALKGEAKIRTEGLYPYQIVPNYFEFDRLNELEKAAMESKWQAMKDGLPDLSGTIVVRDGSGSMMCDNGFPDRVATSLAILFSEYLKGPFKDSFITFSSHPEIVRFQEGMSLYDKLEEIHRYDDVSNTDILKVYRLILELETIAQPIKRVLIISDMEFDQGAENVPTYETFKSMFEEKGLPLPQVIYLNVNSHGIRFSATKEDNVLLLSGASRNLVSLLADAGELDCRSLLDMAIAPYRELVRDILA